MKHFDQINCDRSISLATQDRQATTGSLENGEVKVVNYWGKERLEAGNGDGPTSHIPAHEATAVAAPFRA